MAITKLYAQMELADGREETVRVLLADKLKYEQTAKIHKWEPNPDTLTGQLFLAWAAATRAGITEATFDQFKGGEVLDVFLSNENPDADADEAPTSESTSV